MYVQSFQEKKVKHEFNVYTDKCGRAAMYIGLHKKMNVVVVFNKTSFTALMSFPKVIVIIGGPASSIEVWQLPSGGPPMIGIMKLCLLIFNQLIEMLTVYIYNNLKLYILMKCGRHHRS